VRYCSGRRRQGLDPALALGAAGQGSGDVGRAGAAVGRWVTRAELDMGAAARAGAPTEAEDLLLPWRDGVSVKQIVRAFSPAAGLAALCCRPSRQTCRDVLLLLGSG